MRHPQFKPLQWSHHQKFVVIDDTHAFAGGVDFSTGRFDWHEHHVVDPEGKYWWGIVSALKKITCSTRGRLTARAGLLCATSQED